MFFSLHFFIGRTCIVEHQNLSKILFCHVLLDFEKRLKIDHFERGISEHFPIAYDGIHMKLLNLEIFISKALTFSYIILISMFSLLSRIWALAHPPSKLGFNYTLSELNPVYGLTKP